MNINRRQLLKALGLGAFSTLAAGSPIAFAGPGTSLGQGPSRVVFFVTPHGLVPDSWVMPIPGGPAGAFAERSLAGLAPADFSTVLRPLHPFRDRLLAVEGLAHSTVLADIAEIMRTGGDLNNHSMGVAGLLTGSRALQQVGAYCTGGARSIDQELALRTGGAGRFGSRVYGYDYVPNSSVAPFSFLGAGKASPIVADPATAFADLLGFQVPAPTGAPRTREESIAALRPSVLDSVSREYELLGARLDAEGQRKLNDHRDLVRQLESSLGAGLAAKCTQSVDHSGQSVTQFMRLIKLAFACDLTRVVTFVAPVPQCPEIGYPAVETIHNYAHQSIAGATSCGQTFSPLAAQVMTDLGLWYAGHFATLLKELDSVTEGSGTLLDHTTVVWLTELATPTHVHSNHFALVAGGGSGFFKTGRYVRYPQSMTSPIAAFAPVGPAHNRLFVSLLQAMGQPDTTFGQLEVTGKDGTKIPLTGALTELHA